MMNPKPNSGKITLGMIKGKAITTSVPIIYYHASDDELEELYLSTDKEKQEDLESEEVLSQLSLSPSKTPEKKSDKEKMESKLEQRSSSIDGNLSEGTSQSSDPWKVLSDIKGKITKTFEEKLHEIKNEHKKGIRNSKENSSISDSEDLIDVTPNEKSISDKQEKVEALPLVDIKEDGSRFMSFSKIKVGLKTKNSEEDSIESGVEAAELNESFTKETEDKTKSTRPDIKYVDVKNNDQELHGTFNRSLVDMILARKTKPKPSFAWLKNELVFQLSYRIFVFTMIIACSYYLFPFPEYILGFAGGVLASITVYDMVVSINRILATVPEDKKNSKAAVPVVEILAVEEHAVLERFEGWLNELPYLYDPQNYHVARTKSVYFRLEGETLRIMETRMRIPKRAVWDEPKHKLKFTRRRTYNLAGAKIELLPEGLIRRRRWSKKYPICITVEKGAMVENVALKDSFHKEIHNFKNKKIIEESTESPAEKKKEKDENKEEEEELIEQEFEDEIDEEEDEDETDEDFTHTQGLAGSSTEHGENDQSNICKLFIFARADRQKEDWYRRLVAATSQKKRNSISSMSDSSSTSQQTVVNESKVATSPSPAFDRPPELSYNLYMSQYLDTASTPASDIEPPLSMCEMTWLNGLLGRILFDMHKCPETINLIQDKIQRKLSNIKLPYFMESLLVSDMIIGQKAPIIQDASKPITDERGLWIDLNLLYKGCLTMTIETKLNLMKLTRAGSMSSNSSDVIGGEKSKIVRSPMFDSDVEDSPETSTEEEDKSNMAVCTASKDTPTTQSSGKKFLNMVDRLAANKYFQHATELSYVRKAMEGVSNTEIRLTVSVSGIEGCLSLNIPPPPCDRLWYGFKPIPKISITVRPALGERILNIGYVTKWIETKLLREFEKIVVLPNMDDLIIPLCPNYPYVTT